MEMHDDDRPVGRILTRREVLALLGGSGAALIAGISVPGLVSAQDDPPVTPSATPLPACVVRPELSEGPFFFDDQLNRVDIRVDPTDDSIKEGMPLRLIYRVSDVTGGMCAPLAGAQVDVWHCDADGVYSGVQSPGTDDRDPLWLRGYQVTDEDGSAEFLTIVPGWYPGRAVHIHFKIRTDPGAGASYEFTSQLFFDPQQIEDIYALEPYADRGLPNTPNERDGIFQRSGDQLTLALVSLTEDERDALEVEDGYSATFDIGLDLSDTRAGARDGMGGRF